MTTIKKLSKKGFTMVELMVSISIIAIVMVFLVRLLVDAKYDVTNEIYDTADQINRAQIIKTIENNLKDKNITSVIASPESSEDKLIINILTESETHTIEVESDNFKYKDASNKTTKWSLKGKKNGAEYVLTNIKCQILKNGLNDYIITINIPVIMDDKKADSQMDNIILTFYGNSAIEPSTEDLNQY